MLQPNTDSPQLDALLTALANPKRRGMILALSLKPATVTELADEQNLSLPAIHKHIRLLEAANLIQRKKVGRVNFIALNKKSLRIAQDWIAQFHAEWGNEQESLDNYVAHMRE